MRDTKRGASHRDVCSTRDSAAKLAKWLRKARCESAAEWPRIWLRIWLERLRTSLNINGAHWRLRTNFITNNQPVSISDVEKVPRVLKHCASSSDRQPADSLTSGVYFQKTSSAGKNVFLAHAVNPAVLAEPEDRRKTLL